MRTVRVARVYDDPSPEDGTRVLVDRLWPRGLRKELAKVDIWCRSVSPSTELRVWYGHDPERFEEFAERYRAELADPERQAALRGLLETDGTVTLLTATKSLDISQAAVLADVLRSMS
ncbi:DUF488 domain-containing protein [Kutzneria kofuensis]|uniref:Uncharacterized protein YeaO (DUF488 family) n=1 Tax=Kutzneria kofuensis TaxID=103725 RepID=A0A7W9KB74_9PSEU|nr:DUF488 family protein [Kutzneria kofuensis]MBB5889306.1 uncharacterized protein YeaO (DUF488 family) [Kutzneria kofuensis]